MLGEYVAENIYDANGNPSGGYARGVGIDIAWQDGPLGRGKDRKDPNGAFVETVIDIARQRLKFFQEGPFACEENALAIEGLNKALHYLNERTLQREARGVEGTHTK